MNLVTIEKLEYSECAQIRDEIVKLEAELKKNGTETNLNRVYDMRKYYSSGECSDLLLHLRLKFR